MGKRFTVKTFAAVGLMAVFTAMSGRLLMGTGMLILFRHRAGRYMAL